MTVDDATSTETATTETSSTETTSGAPLVTQPLLDAIAEAEKLVASADFAETEQDLAEGYDYLAGSIAAIVQLVRARSISHPNFVTSTGPSLMPFGQMPSWRIGCSRPSQELKSALSRTPRALGAHTAKAVPLTVDPRAS